MQIYSASFLHFYSRLLNSKLIISYVSAKPLHIKFPVKIMTSDRKVISSTTIFLFWLDSLLGQANWSRNTQIDVTVCGLQFVLITIYKQFLFIKILKLLFLINDFVSNLLILIVHWRQTWLWNWWANQFCTFWNLFETLMLKCSKLIFQLKLNRPELRLWRIFTNFDTSHIQESLIKTFARFSSHPCFYDQKTTSKTMDPFTDHIRTDFRIHRSAFSKSW